MEVILLERIERLGQMGDVVVVKDGFARNFLLPKNKALRANKENLEKFSIVKQADATFLCNDNNEPIVTLNHFEGNSNGKI